MAVCRRRATGTRLLVAVSLAWVLLLLLFLLDRQEVKPPLPGFMLDASQSAVVSARQDIEDILKSGEPRPVPAPVRAGPEPIPIPHPVTPPSRKTPTTKSLYGREGGEARMVLLPPREANGPGELGKPVVLPKNLTKEQQVLVDAGWKANAFNQYASDMISLHRSLPDVRDDR